MNDKLKEMIAPRWIEEQQGVYIPLIDKVLLKKNVPGMPYDDYMDYANANNKQIATKEELLQMYLQKDEINKILEEHGGDLLKTWFGSSSEYYSFYEWFVNFDSGSCYTANKVVSYQSRAVVALKENKNNNEIMEHFSLEEYLKNPNRKIVTKDGRDVRIICTDAKNDTYSIVAVVMCGGAEYPYSYSSNGRFNVNKENELDLFFAPEKHEGWVNVYKDEDTYFVGETICNTKEEAKKYAFIVATVKIEWEE